MRIRRTGTRKEFEGVIDDYITRGYDVESRGERNVRLKKKEYGSAGGHILVALLTFWWTFGIGNAIYAWVKYSDSDEVVIRFEEDNEADPPGPR